MFTKTIKITLSPFSPDLEVVGPFIMKVQAPYSEKMVTIQLNPNIIEYQDEPKQKDPNIQIRQVMVTTNTPETKTLIFDFEKNNINNVEFNNKIYSVKLLNIGKKNIEKQDFPEFEFFIEEIERS